MNDSMRTFLVNNLNEIGKMTQEYVVELEKLKIEARNRFASYYGRKKIFDILFIINLIITPFLFGLLAYITFLK
ncbi:hypothetical protein I5677_16745 [Mobilitalea sibirica]|uniref:Uncharacterized protein n=1 Tax=Mobilitalea sibirica TaxID=1462919 RepID=A0A8J7H5E7_9FIRM|nr:hypothetical protein [Mobilitalea sibirica]MBH1942542.1 hypothetical protein [Mobilitalea sibirica]